MYPEHEVAQFEIRKDCEASNEHSRIKKVLTAKLATKVWKYIHNIIPFHVSQELKALL